MGQERTTLRSLLRTLYGRVGVGVDFVSSDSHWRYFWYSPQFIVPDLNKSTVNSGMSGSIPRLRSRFRFDWPLFSSIPSSGYWLLIMVSFVPLRP